ncbi:hypothetical protein [Flavihumibacter sp. UBA7668]|uniref:hypothetical protein n=1 Tax=Flavihumibacter sp. UBA7668 TaxID=1946542 RepID=UPI0025C283D3|nr:hypothetical protein [Flavihumibacter sp. UBA7668]
MEESADVGQNPFRLCLACHNRLINRALRPLEFFNLVAIHGHCPYLHDDFYDYDTGKATQPNIEVTNAEKHPFPNFEQIKDDLNKIIDFSFVQFFTDNYVITELAKFDKQKILTRLKEKVEYNRAINHKAYEIAGKVVGKTANKWILKEWTNRKANEIQLFAEALAKCLDTDDAFETITTELESGNDKYLSENVLVMIYLQSEKTLDWIEKVSHRINNISSNWGYVAANSQFSWNRANKWLTSGRPLSLIALDGLAICTTIGERLNQSLWLRKLNPTLTDQPSAATIAHRLNEYLVSDYVPRTKNAVDSVIRNVFETGK